jgi:ubiquinone/menaquinone biosynthesis C-methylase UbiE
MAGQLRRGHAATGLTAGLAAAILLAHSSAQTQEPLFAPKDLGLLEAPDRQEWQQPIRIMDALNIADGSRVADIGAGGGWFTLRLARQVGPNGRVFAEDIQPLMIESIKRRITREGLKNVEPILGTAEDPMLPGNLQAVLMCDVYPQLKNPVALLTKVRAALAPNGLVGIVDFKTDGAGGPGPPLGDRIEPDAIIRDARAAGLELRSRETFLKYQYFLVFVRP